jgi:hypothetical protein
MCAETLYHPANYKIVTVYAKRYNEGHILGNFLRKVPTSPCAITSALHVNTLSVTAHLIALQRSVPTHIIFRAIFHATSPALFTLPPPSRSFRASFSSFTTLLATRS